MPHVHMSVTVKGFSVLSVEDGPPPGFNQGEQTTKDHLTISILLQRKSSFSKFYFHFLKIDSQEI